MTTINQIVADATAKIQTTKDKNIKVGNMPAIQSEPGAPKLDLSVFTTTGKVWKDAQK